MMHNESPRFRHFDFDSEKTAALIGNLITWEHATAFVALSDRQIVGMMGGFVAEHMFGPDKVASEVGLYVVPEHRGTTAAVRLLSAFEEWAARKGALDIVLGISTEVAADRTRHLYTRLGYVQSGYLMRKGVDHV